MNALEPLPPVQIRPCGLVSLLDMLPLYAKPYLELGEVVQELRSYFAEFDKERSKDQDAETDTKPILDELHRFSRLCHNLQLTISANMLEKYLDSESVPQSVEAYNILIDCIYLELGSRQIFYITQDKVSYYETFLLSKKAMKAFPVATQEIRSAGNCYATDLPTACVYHCMRALESGLRSLAKAIFHLTNQDDSPNFCLAALGEGNRHGRRSAPSAHQCGHC